MPENKAPQKRLFSPFSIVIIIIFFSVSAFNLAAWYFPRLMDLYHMYIYAPSATFISRLPGLFPFSVGEIMIILAVIIVLAAAVLTAAGLIRKNKRLLTAVRRVIVVILIYVYFTETCNCFVLYHTTELTERLAHYAAPDGYSTEQVVELCRKMILDANELALVVNRDEEGNIILPDDLASAARDSFAALYEDIPELRGYCPPSKRLISSTLMTQLDLQGVYFPFALEGAYNAYVSPARTPTTTFHETAHIKGFIREDEATFISCAACLASDVPEIRYSGCIEAMNYLYGECRKYATEEQIYSLRCDLTHLVAQDNYFVSEEHMKQAEESVIPKEKVNAAGDAAMNTTLKVNGIKDGKNSYSRMVTLLLIYELRAG